MSDKPDKFEKLATKVDEAAKITKNIFLIYLLVVIYAAITIFGITDKQLIFENLQILLILQM